jgi:hypothetical protein
MGTRTLFDPLGSNSRVVDHMIGNAYPAVKLVADNLDYIVFAANNLEPMLKLATGKIPPAGTALQSSLNAEAQQARKAELTLTTALSTLKTDLTTQLNAMVAKVDAASKSVTDLAAASLTTKTNNSTVSRPFTERFAETVNVRDFGAKGDGTTDDLPAFQAARDSVPMGAKVRIYAPKGSYKLSQNFTAPGRVVWVDCDPGVTFPGADCFVDRFTRDDVASGPWFNEYQWFGTGPAVAGTYETVTNTTGSTAVGFVRNYTSYAVSADVGESTTSEFKKLDQGAVGSPHVNLGVSPDDPGSNTSWGVTNRFATVNRGPDAGWAPKSSGQRNWTGVNQLMPDAGAAFSGSGNNLLFGLALSQSVDPATSGPLAGKHAKLHNGVLVEPDAITQTGYGAYLSGSSTPDTAPEAAVGVGGNWQTGVDLTQATFSEAAIKLAVGQKIQVGGKTLQVDASGNIILDGELILLEGLLIGGGQGAPIDIYPGKNRTDAASINLPVNTYISAPNGGIVTNAVPNYHFMGQVSFDLPPNGFDWSAVGSKPDTYTPPLATPNQRGGVKLGGAFSTVNEVLTYNPPSDQTLPGTPTIQTPPPTGARTKQAVTAGWVYDLFTATGQAQNGTNGFLKIGDTILQWGQYTAPNGVGTIIYPLAFPNAVFSVTGNVIGNAEAATVYTVSFGNINSTKGGINVIASRNGTPSTVVVSYFAIGK